MKKNIIFPIEFNHYTGGMIHSVVSLAKGLAKSYNVYFMAYKEAEILKLDPSIKPIALQNPWSISISSPLKTLRTYFEVKDKLKNFHPNDTIIFTNNVGSELIFSGFGVFPLAYKRIFVSRGGDYLGKTGYFLKKGFTSVYKFIAISDRQKNTLLKLGIKETVIHKIHNGIQSPSFDKELNSSITNLSIIGYINPNKNQLLAIEALNTLIKQNYNLKLNIYGIAFTDTDKKYKKILEKRIIDLGLQENVIFHGFEKDQSLIFRNTDILLSCSISEGFGRSVAEAMAYGIPCIGLHCSGGLLDIITDSYDGFLINNDKDELALTIKKLTSNNELTTFISLNAKNTFIQKFTEELMIQNYLKLLAKE